MKQLFAIILLIISSAAIAQNTATPSKVDGKDLYIQLINTTSYDFVENVRLTKEQIAASSTLEERIKNLLSNAKSSEFDALMTRDGNSVQLIKYKEQPKVANVPNYFGKEVYFLSNPTKKYNIISTKEITNSDLKKSFYKISKLYSNDETISYDAVIISGNKVDYIKYK